MSRPAKQMYLIVGLLTAVLCAGKTIEGLRQKFGVILLAIMRAGDDMEFNPSNKSTIEPGNVLIAMGERSMLKRMEVEVED